MHKQPGKGLDMDFASALQRKLDAAAASSSSGRWPAPQPQNARSGTLEEAPAGPDPEQAALMESLKASLANGQFETQVKRKLAAEVESEAAVGSGWHAPNPTQGDLPPLGVPNDEDDVEDDPSMEFQVKLRAALQGLGSRSSSAAGSACALEVASGPGPGTSAPLPTNANPSLRMVTLSKAELASENAKLREEISGLRSELQRRRQASGLAC